MVFEECQCSPVKKRQTYKGRDYCNVLFGALHRDIQGITNRKQGNVH